MRWLFSLFLVLCVNTLAYADIPRPFISNVGRAPFALMSPTFPCSSFLSSLKELDVWHIATLYNTFGNDFRCWDKMVKSPKMATIELNLINEPGQRNGRLGSYEFLASLKTISNWNKLLTKEDKNLKKKFTSYTKLARQKINQLPSQVSCLINPGLESNLDDSAGKVLIAWTKELFPRCRVVWNPLSASTTSVRDDGADFIEGHGKLPPVDPACLVNMDGTDVDFPERKSILDSNSIQSGNPLMQFIATYADKCEIVFVWTSEDNCNYSTGFIDPRKRNCAKSAKVFQLAASEVNNSMNKIKYYTKVPWSDKENKSLDSCTAFGDPTDGRKKGFLLKQAESRSRGGVVILPKGTLAQKVEVLSNGKVINTFTRNSSNYNEDGSNRPLWRSNLSPVNMPFHIVIRLTNNKSKLCFQIDDPQIRID